MKRKKLLLCLFGLISCVIMILTIFIYNSRPPYKIKSGMEDYKFIESLINLDNFKSTGNQISSEPPGGIIKEFSTNSQKKLYIRNSFGTSMSNKFLQFDITSANCEKYRSYASMADYGWELGKCGGYYYYFISSSSNGIMFITNTSREELDLAIKDFIKQGEEYLK